MAKKTRRPVTVEKILKDLGSTLDVWSSMTDVQWKEYWKMRGKWGK